MEALTALRAAVAEQEQARAVAEQARVDERLQAFRQAVINKIGPAVLDELCAKFYWNGSRDLHGGPVVRLTYREHQQTFERKISHSDIADWANDVDDRIAQDAQRRQIARDRIINDLSDASSQTHLAMCWRHIQQENFADDSDVVNAYLAAESQVNEIVAETVQEQTTMARELIAHVREVTEPVVGWRGQLEDVQVEFDRSCAWVAADVKDEFSNAIEAAEERLNRVTEQRQARRLAAQAEAFFPFYVYNISYNLGAMGDESGEWYVETANIKSLSPDPDKQGWYTDIYGRKQRLLHVCKVVRHEITEPRDLLSWCPTVETEWGPIRVSPPDAERITD